MIVISVGDIHQLFGFAAADSLKELFYMKPGRNIQPGLNLAVHLMPDKYVRHRTAQIHDQIQLVFCLPGGMAHLEHFFREGRPVNQIAAVGGDNLKTGSF